ncbi:hypothetical protein NFB56_07695 [Yersinia ruckeri]|uniref:hypothetical protein n=1 Tax=Yersinia ruckeri TaxID=29486 RepID=UPI00119EAC89|nr:hypothetical protein [Yersinia ruckeri]EKN3348014.1 hypothetical protein [Yersinia ruckeri]ELM3746393.1 hypothetical protein [Yersinia ruckeri]MCK8560901.1 hypothetical protein [Yersinia ruckeri]MCW6548749.1 hypothetical protein [Yersinia ruckeri]MCW6635025.1 hypothetical protein [Yersinia ruckeri]
MGQINTDESPLTMQEWNQKVGLRHLDRIKELFKKDPDEEFERRLESLSRGKTKGIIYYAAGIKKDSHKRKAVRKAALDLWIDLNSIPKDLL